MSDTEDTVTDPMEGADVGETRTVRETVELHTVNFSPDVFFGSDRFGDYLVADLDVTEDEYGDEVVAVTFEGELTKALPRRWDRSREPLTKAEEKRERRSRWVQKLLPPVVTLGVLAVGLHIAGRMMESVAGSTIEIEPVDMPGVVELFPVVVLLLFIVWSLPRLPGYVGGIRG